MDDKIDKYLGYFREQVYEVQSLSVALYKKMLCVAIIDALSRAAFPGVQEHRKRVLTFLDTCSRWEDRDRVSAFQLKLALEDARQTANQLYAEVKKITEGWGEREEILPASDPDFERLKRIAEPTQTVFCKSARYVELLYTYRNHLVHEFREPGHGIEMSGDPTSPYYHSMNGSPWELVFPVPFFLSLCHNCIEGMGTYLRSNGINPYDSYEFGTIWRRK